MRPATESSPAPDDTEFLAVFDFTGYEEWWWEDPDCPECSTVTFDSPVPLILSYPQDDLSEDVVAVFMAYFDEELNAWVPVPEPPPDLGMIAGIGESIGMVSHFSQVAILAELLPPPPPAEPAPPPPPVPPAQFTLSGLDIVSSTQKVGVGGQFIFRVKTGERVTVSADVVNNGGQQGTYLAELKINGDTYESREINLDPGESETLVFTVAGLKPGRYVLELAGLSGEFETSVWHNGWLIGGIASAIALLSWVAWYYGYYRKRRFRA